MTQEEVKNLLDKLSPDCLVVKVDVIKQVFGCCDGAAYKILREIRSYSNIACLLYTSPSPRD